MIRAAWLRSALACALLVGVNAVPGGGIASAQAFTHSAIIRHAGYPTLLVDGRPFFFFGAAFFYERIPAPQWRPSMLAIRKLGFNTLDVYVPWNWHELADGDFDFSGRTNARRNLRGFLALARELGFRLIVRPGPVIRNEWRNGGYPAWLLTRPEYGMPLHDVLEGRYPATATLQNAHSDDAAGQWMRNATHMRYAQRWLRTVLREFTPVADRVVAVALDDDQAAYIDNQTWPAPHLQAYLRRLEATVRGIVGPTLPVFINTYEMKVTASAPVWPMGNWYQSDAYTIGEHDRSALEFSTGLLQTQPRYPVAISEFQAGWLAQPEDPAPRPADPTNTTLALHTLLGMGARGAIDFPAQDTVNPAGWEAPFANMSYAWDAALAADLTPSRRYAPTARFGALIARYGPALARARRLTDGAIAYLTSAYDERRLTNTDIFAIAARTQDAQRECRARRLTCDLVDLRFVEDRELRRYPFLIVPAGPALHAFIAPVMKRLLRYGAGGGRIFTHAPVVAAPRNGGIADATVLVADGGRTAFLDIVNYDSVPHTFARTHIRLSARRIWAVGPLRIAARDAVLLRSGSPVPAPLTDSRGHVRPAASIAPRDCMPALRPATPAQRPTLTLDDPAADGFGRATLANGLVSATFAPSAGARAFSFNLTAARGCAARNVFTSVGSLRDDAEVQPPLSITDRIGKYTRSFPPGTFNRTYRLERKTSQNDRAGVVFEYTAPDVVPNGARFVRSVSLSRGERAFSVTQRVTFAPGPRAALQRAVRYDSFDSRRATVIDERRNGAVGFFYPASGMLASVSWPVSDVEQVLLLPERTSTVVRLRFAAGGARQTRYALETASGVADARRRLRKERGNFAAKP